MHFRALSVLALIVFAPHAALAQGSGLSGGGSGYTLIPIPGSQETTNPDPMRQLQDFADRLCQDGQTPAANGCIALGQTDDLGALFGLPPGCLQDPCAPGCPGQERMLCLPSRLTMSGTAGNLPKSDGDADAISAQTLMPAEGGMLAVTTYGDGSHEVHQFVSGQGFVLVESGGGAGGHSRLLDQVRRQWALQ